ERVAPGISRDNGGAGRFENLPHERQRVTVVINGQDAEPLELRNRDVRSIGLLVRPFGQDSCRAGTLDPCRKFKSKLRALALAGAGRKNLATLKFNEVTGDRETETEAAVHAVDRG